LNSRGGYESDVTVTRTAHDEYLVVSSSGSVTRDQDWILRHRRKDERVDVLDVSSSYAMYGVMGPRSRDLLASLSRADFSDDAWPFSTSRLIDLGYSTVRATRITYVGELGWELYVPTDFAVGVYELLKSEGVALGLVEAGYYSINSLRLEKAYRAWGSDLTPDYSPAEAGLLFTCKLRSDIDFLGRGALESIRSAGPRRRLVSLVVQDPEPMLWGGELVARGGAPVGQVTSAAWGATLGSCVALAYVWRPDGEAVSADFLTSGDYQVDVGGDRYRAEVHLKAPFDPGNLRIRG
jgi:glycine cleavage system aminomethyltransferase T